MARGDLICLAATLSGTGYGVTATARGDVTLLALPADLVQRLATRHPEAVARAESTLRAKLERQARAREVSLGNATRQAVHERGLKLMNSLHEGDHYERIIIVSHSLGTMLAHDLLSYFWAQREAARKIAS